MRLERGIGNYCCSMNRYVAELRNDSSEESISSKVEELACVQNSSYELSDVAAGANERHAY